MQERVSTFAWNVPPAFNFARDVVDVLGNQERTGLVALSAGGAIERIGFPAIAAATRRWAGAFDALGVRKGDRVIVLLPKIPQWLYAMVALDRLGAVVIPCSEQLRAKDLAFRANHAEASAIVAHASNREEVDLLRAACPGLQAYLLVGGDAPSWVSLDERVARAPEFAGNPTRAQEPAYIMYTSGTTKDPKGVVQTHAYTFAKRMQAEVWLDAKSTDLVWSTAGTGWAKSLWNILLGPWSCGSAIVLDASGFDAVKRMNDIRDLGVTI
jgi:acyl-coenzyme A synthetase/AMP-(fatty) acid ligase